jgi:hypothetical protein
MTETEGTSSTEETMPRQQKNLPSLYLAQIGSLTYYFPSAAVLSRPFRLSDLLAASCAVRRFDTVRGQTVYLFLYRVQP